jgi:hypothetical protein
MIQEFFEKRLLINASCGIERRNGWDCFLSLAAQTHSRDTTRHDRGRAAAQQREQMWDSKKEKKIKLRYF